MLERVSVEVEKGAFCTLVGASGCGKSTLLRILLSQEQQTRGEVMLDGKPLPSQPTEERGIVFQKYSTFPHLTVEENLIISEEFSSSKGFGRLFGSRRKPAIEKAQDIVQKIGLSHARKRYPSQLSGGMQQRLAIGQALLKKPEVLLLDEPFGALDPGIRGEMHELLTGLWEEFNMTIFMVTHDIAEAFKLGTRLLVFDKIRHDPIEPQAYGATITYDLALSSEDKRLRPDPDELFPSKPKKSI